jgi:nicotinamidase/pyrazinamidase
MAEALLIIDVQNDFTPPEGALAVPEGDRVIPPINRIAGSEGHDLVVATRDWHPPDHGSFEPHGGPWPPHCVQETEGAELHPELDREPIDVVLDKGQAHDTDGYSPFERPELVEILREKRIEKLLVVGLATDYCVKNAALDAAGAGYEVEVDASATRGVDPHDSMQALREVQLAGGRVRGGPD